MPETRLISFPALSVYVRVGFLCLHWRPMIHIYSISLSDEASFGYVFGSLKSIKENCFGEIVQP